MRKQFLIVLLLFFFILKNSFLFSQEDKPSFQKTKITFSEKIYIQLNSTIFTSDQTIWFKTIVTDVNQTPTFLSKILHVELIDFDKRIVDTKLLKLEKGIANGSFDLKEILPLTDGKYMIRAYTKWNENFNENFINQQYIDIYKPKRVTYDDETIRDVVISENEKKQLELSAKIYPRTINPKYNGKLVVQLNLDGTLDTLLLKKVKKKNYYTFNYLLPKDVAIAKMNVKLDSIRLKNNNLGFLSSYSKTIVINENSIDLQFFPEGGKLIHGLTSVIGFKALDYKNEGIHVVGNIIDQDSIVVNEFKSNELGMGTFQLKPNNNKTYSAVVKLKNDITYTFKLPKIYSKGYAFTAKTIDDFFKVKIISNFSKTDSLSVKIQFKGITYHHLKVKSKNGKVHLAVDRKALPEGIITFTVFDQLYQTICERLLFNYKESEHLKITTKTDKKRYRQRDKIVFDIQIDNKDSLPLKTSTSFLVLNKSQLGTMQLKKQNILSYFLLQSELKGTIEQPNYYFDTKNKHRFYAMDALLLTQGWRNYVYKPSIEKINFTYPQEQKLQISGTIDEYVNQKKRRKKPVELTLLAFGKERKQFGISSVDSLGRFSFNLEDSYNENLEYIIQTKNHKGKKKNYTINIDKTLAPEVSFKKTEKLQLADALHTYFVQENMKRVAKENPFSAYNGIALDEIKITARIYTPKQQKMNEEHGEPDTIIESKELESKIKKWSYGLYSILLFNYPEDVDVKRVGVDNFLYANVYGADFTFALVDGIPVQIEDYNLLETLPTEEIKSVDIYKNPKNPLKYWNDVFNDPYFACYKCPKYFSFLNIYTYSGKGLFGVQNNNGIFKNTLPSFAPKKEFYAPKHDNLTKNDWDFPDFRSTLFWQPNVQLDKNNIGKVKFYNDDNIGEMLVIIESIFENGQLGYYETSYKVHERLDK